jgi:hypothetical protein
MKVRTPCIVAIAWLLAMVPASSQPDRSALSGSKRASSAPSKPLPVSANDPVSKIADAYRKEQNEFYQHMPKNASDSEVQKYYAKFDEIPKRYLPLLNQVAAKQKGASEGAEALLLILQIAPSSDPAATRNSLAQLNSPTYIKLPMMERVASQLFYVYPPNGSGDRNALLRNLIAQSPHDKVKAAAMFTLAASAVDNFAPPSADIKRDDALAILRELKDKYPTTDYSKRAEGYIFAAEKLQVGMTAPDIEGEDVDGAKFKLSDYRDKVVVLDFWGFW